MSVITDPHTKVVALVVHSAISNSVTYLFLPKICRCQKLSWWITKIYSLSKITSFTVNTSLVKICIKAWMNIICSRITLAQNQGQHIGGHLGGMQLAWKEQLIQSWNKKRIIQGISIKKLDQRMLQFLSVAYNHMT